MPTVVCITTINDSKNTKAHRFGSIRILFRKVLSTPVARRILGS